MPWDSHGFLPLEISQVASLCPLTSQLRCHLCNEVSALNLLYLYSKSAFLYLIDTFYRMILHLAYSLLGADKGNVNY